MKMETIKIFQTAGSNSDLLSMRTFKAFTVVVYDFWMSECIKANRRTSAEQAKMTKRHIADYWGKYAPKTGIDLQELAHQVYPDGVVSRIRDARCNFRKKFLAATKELSTLVVDTADENQEGPPFVFECNPDVIDNMIYPKFSYQLIQRVKAAAIPSPLDVPVVLYRPLGRTASPMSFIMNRRMLVHWKMNEKRLTSRTTIIPIRSFVSWFHLEDPKKWSSHKTSGWADGLRMWADRVIRPAIEAYGLFSFDGLVRARSHEQSIQITRLFD